MLRHSFKRTGGMWVVAEVRYTLLYGQLEYNIIYPRDWGNNFGIEIKVTMHTNSSFS